MKQLFSALILTLAMFQPLAAQTPAAAPPLEFKKLLDKVSLQDGDSVVFLGDSITHQCLYTQYLEDYFYTRFPDRRIRFHNSGVGGDRAADALIRFEPDVAAFKPKYVTILLGMNDGRYTKMDPEVFDTYERDMNTLLDRLNEIGALAIPMTPTMHDARAARLSKRGGAEPRDTYYNSVLAYFGSWLREQTHVRGLGFVDMYSPLNNLTMEQRRTDPNFTLIKDAVHPDAPGQVVMAVAMLEQLFERAPVSSINLTRAADGKLRGGAVNGKITDLQGSDTISFNFKANALPWVLPAEAAIGYQLTKAGHRYSNEKVRAGNLAPGKYELRIDGQPVGAFTSDALARGIELQENDQTPQYQQALAVAELNKERNDKAVRPLRNLWRDRKIKRAEENWLAQNANHQDAPARRAAFEKWRGEFDAGIPRLQALAREYEDRIYQANQPPVRKYELSRAN